jgi:hypothetical protein
LPAIIARLVLTALTLGIIYPTNAWDLPVTAGLIAGGILIGSATYDRLPDGALVEERAGLHVKGRAGVVDAYLLVALP